MSKSKIEIGKKALLIKKVRKVRLIVFLISAFVIATCGLAYELIAATVASYLLGDSVTQFSFSIGIYMFAMGIGSYLSRYINEKLTEKFIEIELILALVGGLSALILFLLFSYSAMFQLALWALLFINGCLVGLEIPILLRILKKQLKLKDLVSQVLSLDYIGGLVAAIAFPVFLVPRLGLIRTSVVFGLLNAVVALFAIIILKNSIAFRKAIIKLTIVSLILITVLFEANKLQKFSESQLYADRIVHYERTPFQKIILTKWNNEFSLFLNNNLQFNSRDEYRYHESLVHPAFQLFANAQVGSVKNVLVLGGGDGLATRELLKYGSIKNIVLVDLDPAITKLGKENIWLKRLNHNSLNSKKVTIINKDAFKFLNDIPKDVPQKYDIIIIDFPDPSNFSLGKLYSVTFFKRLKKIFKPNSVAVIQSTSPLFARKSFWSINQTILVSGFATKPFHCYVPSFGEWGYVAFSPRFDKVQPFFSKVKDLRFLNKKTYNSLFDFAVDMQPLKVEPQTLNSQKLVQYYDEEWKLLIK